MRRIPAFVVLLACIPAAQVSSWAQEHNPGQDCLSCHPGSKVAGTVFSDASGATTLPGASLRLIGPDGQVAALFVSNQAGNVRSAAVATGNYLVELENVSSKTWHNIPAQSSCNTCHEVGGNPSQQRTKLIPEYHNRVPPGNRCRDCHYFPASMRYGQLMTSGVLVGDNRALSNDDSFVELNGQAYDVEPADLTGVQTVRPDVFVPGYYSAFDVILAVAADNGISIQHHWDESAKTHWITSVDGVPGDYWYGWANDNGQGVTTELNWGRDNRWDEMLWREGTKLRLNEGTDDLPALRDAFRREIATEIAYGGPVVGIVELTVDATDYQGNPPGSGRISANLTLTQVAVTPHDLRGAIVGAHSVWSRPFQPGVVTSMDVLFSLEDVGTIDNVQTVLVDRIATSLIQSHFMQGFEYPGGGLSHASGSHGLACSAHLLEEGTVYAGVDSQNVNAADGSLHVPHDILPIHAPDYSLWRWLELGPPYYESAEPQPAWALGPTIELERVGATELRIRWPATPCEEQQSYGIYEGILGLWDSHESVDCSDDGADLEEVVSFAPGNRYYLIVPHAHDSEGSYGSESNGFERRAGGAACASDQYLVCP